MRNHYAAVKSRLLADPALTGKVHDTALVDAGGLPVVGTYAILYGGAPDLLASNRFTAPQSVDSDAEYVYTIRAVSTTADGVRSVQSKVAAQLVGHALVVAGRQCRVEQTDTTEIDWDKATNPPLFFADQEFTVYSSRV